MSEPLPLSYSPVMPWPARRALMVVLPMSNSPSMVYSPYWYQSSKRRRMSSVSMRPGLARMLSQTARAMLVSSLHVPAGWSWVPWPVMVVAWKVPRRRNS